MKITSKWIVDDAYIQDYWNDWIKYRSKHRKWAIHYGIFLIVASLILLLLFPIGTNLHPLLLFGIFIGIAIIIWHFYDKAQWMKLIKKAISYGEENTVIFSRENLKIKGPTSNGEMIWKGIESIEKGELGFFLILQKGLSIYIPYHSLDNKDGFTYIDDFYAQSKIA